MKMMPDEAKAIIKELGYNGKRFSLLLGVNENYVSDFNRSGVSSNMAIILKMSIVLHRLGENPIEIITKYKK